MTEQARQAPAETSPAGPAAYYADLLESACERGRSVALCHNGDWYSGVPVTVSRGVLVLERRGKWVQHLRIADVSAVREYLDNGQGGRVAG